MVNNTICIVPKRFNDKRGFFAETYNVLRYREMGIDVHFVQDNHSLSIESFTLRGLHFQEPPHPQGKLVQCSSGAIFDVVLDIRRGSPNYGQWEGYELTPENGKQLYVPVGFAHGFVTLKPNSEIIYKCTDYYSPNHEKAIRWDSCNIKWPINCKPILSDKDKNAPSFEELDSPFFYGKNS